MNGNRRIAQHRFRSRGGDRDVTWFAGFRIDDRILIVPEVAVDCLAEDLVVADGGLQERVPVNESLAAIDELLRE